ncbi:MAG: BRCT domain-containing protein, partial [Planctomycetaceae bacterium]
EVDEIGPIIAGTVHTFFASPDGTDLIGALRAAGVHLGPPRPTEPEDDASDRIFEGRSLVVTGTLERFKRDEIKELIRSHGGRAAGSVSSKTDIVIAGKNAGSKLAKAQQLGIPILTEEALLAAVQSGQLPDAVSDSLAPPSAADDATPDPQPPPPQPPPAE